jgi:multiple antibiotic resistance protein
MSKPIPSPERRHQRASSCSPFPRPAPCSAFVLQIDNATFTIAEPGLTTLFTLSVLMIAYVLMRLVDPVIRLIGNAGAAIIGCVMGMILASVAAHTILEALIEIVATGEL